MQCTSKKKSFENHRQAEDWIKLWNATNADKTAMTYTYLCYECGMWHVTSNAKVKLNQVQKIRKRVLDQNESIEQSILDIAIFKRDLIHIKKQMHDKLNHLQAILKTNKQILEKLKEM